MIISTDVDEVLNNLITTVLEQYNTDSGDELSIEQITDYDITKFVQAGYNIWEYFKSDYTYEHLKWDVQWVADIIDNNEFEVYFTTSTYPDSCNWKFEALAKAVALASSKPSDFIYNYVRSHFIRMENKQLIRPDVVIDDCISNLQLWNDKVYNILVAKPWNRRLAHQYNVSRRNNAILICNSAEDIVTCLEAIRKERRTDNEEIHSYGEQS